MLCYTSFTNPEQMTVSDHLSWLLQHIAQLMQCSLGIDELLHQSATDINYYKVAMVKLSEYNYSSSSDCVYYIHQFTHCIGWLTLDPSTDDNQTVPKQADLVSRYKQQSNYIRYNTIMGFIEHYLRSVQEC